MQLINVKLFNNGQVVYDANLPSNDKYNDMDQEMKDYMLFIRPSLEYNYMLCTYIRELTLNEK